MSQESESYYEGCEERYGAFIDAVAESREVWILVNEGGAFLKIYAEEEDFEYLPVWPDSDSAAQYAQGESGLVPHSVALPEFMKRWVEGLTQDKLEVGVWPGEDGSVWVLSPEELKAELTEVLSGF
ncbi:MAG: DUF2750 domain-containing protein [Gammaproteobacteria bacterium]|nr:MAG: DUF2750 domain-containing protein [Gammaproteobacteria bacterium]